MRALAGRRLEALQAHRRAKHNPIRLNSILAARQSARTARIAPMTAAWASASPSAPAISRMTAPIAPGPAMSGVASGNTDMSARASASAASSGVVVVAPDVGSAKMARGFAKRLNGTLAIIDKRRPAANVAEVVNVVGEVEGRDCLIPDDMIDTAGTVSEAARALKELGAKDIYVCATHALLSGPAVERLSAAPIAEVAVTDTVAIPPHRQFPQLRVLSHAEVPDNRNIRITAMIGA